MVLHPLRPPAEVVCGGTKGALVLGGAPAAAAGQAVDPGEEGLFEPSQQLQHQEVFYPKFARYKEQTRLRLFTGLTGFSVKQPFKPKL